MPPRTLYVTFGKGRWTEWHQQRNPAEAPLHSLSHGSHQSHESYEYPRPHACRRMFAAGSPRRTSCHDTTASCVCHRSQGQLLSHQHTPAACWRQCSHHRSHSRSRCHRISMSDCRVYVHVPSVAQSFTLAHSLTRSLAAAATAWLAKPCQAAAAKLAHHTMVTAASHTPVG